MTEMTLEKRVEALEAKITVIGTGLNTILTELAGINEAEKAEKQSPSWDPAQIPWVEAEGTKGPYERYPAEKEKPENTPDYRNALADLKGHGGKLIRDGYFIWLWVDNATIGRKKRSF